MKKSLLSIVFAVLAAAGVAAAQPVSEPVAPTPSGQSYANWDFLAFSFTADYPSSAALTPVCGVKVGIPISGGPAPVYGVDAAIFCAGSENLTGVQVDGHDSFGTGCADEVGNHLGADGSARADLAILTGIGIVGNNGGDATGAGALEGIQHEAELHEVAIDARRAGGLHHKNVVAAHIVADLDAQFAIAEGRG